MAISIRPADPARDLPELAAMLDQIMTQGMSVAQLENWQRSRAEVTRHSVAVTDQDAIVGWSFVERSANAQPGRYFISIATHSDHRRRGIGSALFNEILDFTHPRGLTQLTARVRDDNPDWLAWAKQRGFEVERHGFRSSLDLASFDESPFVPALERAENDGIRFFTLADLTDNEETRRALYDLDMETCRDVPGFQQPETFDEYVGYTFESTGYRPDGAIVAVDGDQWIGLAVVMMDEAHDRMWNHMTGVVRDYRSRGIAQALKLLAVRCAQKHGVAEILTENDSQNAPMLAVNRKLGYRPWPGVYELKAEFPSEA